MKKIFSLFVSALMATASFATDYTDNLKISINGIEMSNAKSTIQLTANTDGTYKFALNNFNFSGMPIGNIVLDNVAPTKRGDVTALKSTQDVTLQLGKVPVSLMAEVSDSKMYAIIDVYVEAMKQTVHVVFGSNDGLGYQLKNGGFEDWHAVSRQIGSSSVNGDEPNNWHDMLSCSYGNPVIGYFAAYNPFVFKTDVVRPGSAGKRAALLRSFEIFGIVANGTLTTGRLNAGSTTAEDPSNHAYLDMSKTDKDSNGDPFYQTVNGTPTAWPFGWPSSRAHPMPIIPTPH